MHWYTSVVIISHHIQYTKKVEKYLVKFQQGKFPVELTLANLLCHFDLCNLQTYVNCYVSLFS